MHSPAAFEAALTLTATRTPTRARPRTPRRTLDYRAIFASMMKPAFVFDGRNILDHAKLREIGFIVYALGKPLDTFLQKNYS